jgi:hypothetical protein
MSEYRTIKVRPSTYRKLKIEAAKTGETMLDLVERLIEESRLNVATNVADPAPISEIPRQDAEN